MTDVLEDALARRQLVGWTRFEFVNILINLCLCPLSRKPIMDPAQNTRMHPKLVDSPATPCQILVLVIVHVHTVSSSDIITGAQNRRLRSPVIVLVELGVTSFRQLFNSFLQKDGG